ncbi:MAG TPA: arginine--tRNA ligase [archaeon]|nr:arginine--tRNA ligase [archaeon]
MLEKEVLRLLLSADVKADESKLERPPQKEMGDVAFPCFELAKVQKRNPVEIAVELKKKIKLPKDSMIQRIEVAGPYLNFYYDYQKFVEKVLPNVMRKPKIERKEKIMIEFAHPNTHKGFHIGHFRNICIGESLCRILEFAGHKVHRVNYQGDIGPHIAKTLWAFVNIYKGKVPKEKEKRKAEWLGQLYAEAEKRIEDEKVADEVAEINKNLYEQDDRKILKVWKETRQWSLDYFAEIYKELGTGFEKYYLESQVEKRGKRISEELVKKGLAKVSEGAIVVDLEKYGLGIFVLLSKDKTPLYPAKDLALVEIQFSDFKVDKCIHVVSTEQNLYFRQLFKTFELMKSPGAGKSYHLAYELVTLKEGKMASRLGNVILYGDLRDKMVGKVLDEMKERKMESKDKESTAKMIAIGAMKYAMLRISPEKLVFFDWEDVLKLEGNTGPYIQYAYTRCSSILKKAGKWKKTYSANERLKDEEKYLVSMLARFSGIVSEAAASMKPHLICNYLYELTTALNNFYEKCPVLKAKNAEQKNFRLTLVDATKEVLKTGMQLIGMEAPERM